VRTNIPAQGFVGPRSEKDLVNIVEIGEVGINFDDPVGKAEDDGANEDATPGSGEEWFQFHPGNDIV
jgi:hypothetical protein